MKNILLVVAALLLTDTGNAVAADSSEHQAKNAQKLLATLDLVGLNNKDIKQFVSDANTQVDGSYFNLAGERAMGGRISLRYQLGTDASMSSYTSSRRLEFRYTPDSSHFEGIARTDLVLARYHFAVLTFYTPARSSTT